MKRDKPAGISEKVIRLLEIYTMIAQKRFPSVQFLREHFHVSERSVYRYLEIINMIDGIEYDQERKGYAFTNGDRIKKLSLSDNELLVLFAASEAVSHLGEPLGHGFQELMNRVTAATKRIKRPRRFGRESCQGRILPLCMAVAAYAAELSHESVLNPDSMQL
jgi:predicted DNA-binding transcriptional regulator YafY